MENKPVQPKTRKNRKEDKVDNILDKKNLYMDSSMPKNSKMDTNKMDSIPKKSKMDTNKMDSIPKKSKMDTNKMDSIPKKSKMDTNKMYSIPKKSKMDTKKSKELDQNNCFTLQIGFNGKDFNTLTDRVNNLENILNANKESNGKVKKNR